ncbi:nucleoside monophosphate kinase [Streptomyces sp. NPDC019224]|uniref:adenylate kinase family protein n=1 Tax=Streptomyces sp. NPDC019224 TaxID=3154484 RepID=UPI0033CD8402
MSARSKLHVRPPTVVLIGPPGAGKGTQAAILAHHGFRHLASGDLLRQHIKAQTPLGRQAGPYVRRGDLVPSELVAGLIREGLRECSSKPVVIDGFPKSRTQAVQLDRILAGSGRRADLALTFRADTETLRQRLRGRAQEQRRTDDDATVIERRLAEFAHVPTDLTSYYQLSGILRTIQADAPVEQVAAEVAALLPRR